MTSASQPTIDLNADLGEHDGDGYEHDFALLDVVSSASIACGAHAGSPEVMRRTIAAAVERGVSVGAHPSYNDREGFGRREVKCSLVELETTISDQLDLMERCCREEGATLAYVKPHGALYNVSVKKPLVASVIAECIARIDSSIFVLVLPASTLPIMPERPGSALSIMAGRHNLRVVNEAFIDREYMPDGTLVPRTRDDAVIDDDRVGARRATELATTGKLKAFGGTFIDIDAQSLCVHGDSTNAIETVTETRRQLVAAGFLIKSFAR